MGTRARGGILVLGAGVALAATTAHAGEPADARALCDAIEAVACGEAAVSARPATDHATEGGHAFASVIAPDLERRIADVSARAGVPASLPAARTLVAPTDSTLVFGALAQEAAPEAEEEILVEAKALREEARVGPYGQPEWTTHRRFARSRVYVLPEGTWEFEQWYRGRFDRGEGPRQQFQTEIGVGLPNRWQLDVYETAEHEAGLTKHVGWQFEARWALDDWGELWGNPTLYAEYKLNHRAEDVAEGKILFGDEFSDGWHWAANLSVEQQLGGPREREDAITGALSYTVLDQQLSIGVEAEVQSVSEKGERGDPNYNVFLGPSIQWRPTPNTHLDLVPLFGLRHDDVDLTLFLVFGIDLGGAEEKGVHAPVSTRNR